MNKLFMFMYSIIVSLFTFTKQPTVQQKPNLPLRLGDLQFFAEDPAEGKDKGGGGGGEDDKGGKDGKDEPFATFRSQEELNKRISRAEKAGQKTLAKELGYESVEAMQEALKKTDDKPKPKDKKEEHVDVDTLIENKLKEEREKTFKRVLNSEVKVMANELGFVDYTDALASADLSEVKENEKGDLEGLKEALEALAKAKPHLLKSTNGTNFGSDINRKPKDDKAHLENIAKLAQNRGVQTQVSNDPWKR